MFSFSKLHEFMCSKKKLIQGLRRYEVKNIPKHKRHLVIDTNSPVLLCAHIDTVQTPTVDLRTFTGAGFDDRLGVYLGYALANKYPGMFDLLLTDYEESGQSTAAYFTPTHKYNFVVGLDREGSDYVDYGLADIEFDQAFERHTGIKKSHGSFSDICSMSNVDCTKINLGIGVYSSHSPKSGFIPGVANEQISKLVKFCREYKDVYFKQGVGDIFAGCGYNYSYYNNQQNWNKYKNKEDEDIDDIEGQAREYFSKTEGTAECDFCGDTWAVIDMYDVNGSDVCLECVHRLGCSDVAVSLKDIYDYH